MKDLTNMRFGKLVALYPVKKQGTNWMWQCKCDCGNKKIVCGSHLTAGGTTSCGCHRNEILMYYAEKSKKHGQSRTKLYNIWAGMKKRCNKAYSHSYNRYGARGVHICNEWNSFEPFFNWATTHGYKDGLQIDRIDNNGDYTPENCRFVTPQENCRNRSNNVYTEINGEKLCLSEIANISGLTLSAISNRYKRGIRGESLLSPAKYNGKRK